MDQPPQCQWSAHPAAVERIGRSVDRRTLLRYAATMGLTALLPAELMACAPGRLNASNRHRQEAEALGGREAGAALIHDLADRGPEPGKVLVAIRLPGGHDGLDAVIPYGDPLYAATRKYLAHKPETLLKLDDRFALSPALPNLARRWAARQVAIVHGVHHMRNDLSHFQSIDLWSTGTQDSDTNSGWLGRSLDVLGASAQNPLWGMAIGYNVPVIMTGEAMAPAAVPVFPDGILWDPDASASEPGIMAGLDAFSGELAGLGAAGQLVTDGEHQARYVATTAGSLLLEVEDDGLEAQLRQVSAFIRAGLGTRIYHVTHTGDFDVHSGERGQQTALLGELDQALEGFFAGLGPDAQRIMVMTWSEFGRRPEPNGSGTDHGTASIQFVVGPGVRGGHYGEPPSLRELDEDGNLRATMDYRAVSATVVERWLGVDAARVLPGVHQRLGFL